jgi:hypothetical protein
MTPEERFAQTRRNVLQRIAAKPRSDYRHKWPVFRGWSDEVCRVQVHNPQRGGSEGNDPSDDGGSYVGNEPGSRRECPLCGGDFRHNRKSSL